VELAGDLGNGQTGRQVAQHAGLGLAEWLAQTSQFGRRRGGFGGSGEEVEDLGDEPRNPSP
jgi:hypothetical protein